MPHASMPDSAIRPDRPCTGPLARTALALLAGFGLQLPAADLTTTGGGNVVLDGSNSWIFHSPDDGRTDLYLAPRKNGNWSWYDQFCFNNAGGLKLRTLTSSTGNPIWIGSKVQMYSPGNYQPALEITGEGDKDAFTLYHAWNKNWFSAGTRATDGRFVICQGNNLHNPARFELQQDGSAVLLGQALSPALELAGDNASRFIRYHDYWDAWYSAGYHRGTRKFRICNGGDLESGQLLEMDNGSITAHRHINATSLTASGNLQAAAVRAGYVGTARLQVRSDWWADRVFAKGYRLRPLTEVAAYIQEHQHLPEVPSEADLRRDGINTASMFATQMTKIEELTLHAIDLNQQLQAKDAAIAELQAVQQRQAAQIARLAQRLGLTDEKP